MNRTNARTIGCGAAALLACAGVAGAQQYRGGGGTALDRNLQVGSTGVNPRARDVRDQIWFNNQIIVGNAPAGRSFRGYVGYTAPGDFRGPVGTDANYAFRRDSTSASQVSTGVRASDALRYQMSLTTGQAAPAYLAGSYFTQREGKAATATAVAAGNSESAALRSTADYLATRTLRPTLVSSRLDSQGNEWNTTASGLLGVTLMRIGPATPPGDSVSEPANPNAPAPAGEGRMSATPGAPPATPGGGAPQSATPGAPARTLPPSYAPSGIEARTGAFVSRWERTLAPGRGADASATAQNNAVDTAVGADAVAARSAAHAQVLDAYRNAYGPGAAAPPAAAAPNPVGGEPATPPVSPADQQLVRLRRMLRGLPPEPPVAARPGEATGASSPSAPPGSSPGAQPAPGAGGPAPAEGARPAPTVAPEVLRALKMLGEKNLDSLTPSDSAQSDPGVYRAHMQAAQADMSAGRYFDAEDRFTRALAAMPGDPMARIGRIHAQLGAGMFLSASTNLRRLIQDQPEVVGLKFDPKLAPDPERVKTLTDDLRGRIENGSTGLGLEMSLLLAYLGRITGNQALADEGLGAMRLRLPAGDQAELTLYQTLQGVWGSAPK